MVEIGTAVVELAGLRRRDAARREFRRAVDKATFVRQFAETERDLIRILTPFFVEQVKDMARRLGELDEKGAATAGKGSSWASNGAAGILTLSEVEARRDEPGASKDAGDAAANLVRQIFDPEEWHRKLIDLALPVLAVKMFEAAHAWLRSVGIDLRKSAKVTTATRWLEEHSEDVEKLEEMLAESGQPIGILTESPTWMKRAIAKQLKASFEQPYWRTISETTGGDAERVLRAGLRDGRSIAQMSREMATSFAGDTGRYARIRATNIARTECLPGDTVVDGARVVAVYRRWYTGPFIEVITKAGRKFSGTPNHPMLTLRGWVGLGDLQETDSLVCYNRSVKKPGSSGDVDVEKPPPTISEIFDSLSAVGVLERRRTTKPDFHGDGMEGEVDILTPDGELSYGSFVPVEESGIENILSEPELGKFLLVAQRNPFSRGVGELSGLCVAADSASVSDDEPTNAAGIDVKRLGDVKGRLPVPVPGKNGFSMGLELGVAPEACGKQQSAGIFKTSPGDASPLARSQHSGLVASDELSDFNTAHSGQVEIDHPLVIRCIKSWSGHVFNLTTRDGYFSIAEGAYTGNSGNALNGARKVSMDELSEELGPEVPMRAEWLSVLGTTTRDDHADLDGVPEDEEGMWTLGGIRIPWPAHYSLPPGQRCNCQCTQVTAFGLGEEESLQLIQEHQERAEGTEQ